MKKLLLTIALVLTIGFGANAQRDAFFSWNDASNETYRTGESINFALPQSHGADYDSEAPLGTGLLILTALGAGYIASKRKHE